MPALIALLFFLVIAAFFVSRRAGLAMLGGAAVAGAATFAWTWYAESGPQNQRDAIPLEQVHILETRRRGNTTDYLIRNDNDRWTLVGLRSEKIARLEDGTIIDRREFVHRVEVPPGQARWQTIRFFGLEIGVEYEWRLTGTEGSRSAGR